jgi:glycosyltransferase involved in cell wall biosynthesis
MKGPVRLGAIADYPAEGWPSMDLCAEMLLTRLGPASRDRLHSEPVTPPFRRLPVPRRFAHNAERLLNRYLLYPRHLRRVASHFDLFHVVDHSYAHLLHVLPLGSAGVFCHDLDAFRCVLTPEREPRPRWFLRLTRHVLDGFRRAAVVFHATEAVRGQLLAHGLAGPARLVHAPYGPAPEFTPGLPPTDAGPFLLHVGSCIPRKRIDVLLDVFAAVRARHPGLRLVQVGGTWTAAQRAQIGRLGLASAAGQRRGLSRWELADLYRRAAVVLQPSAAEGFGLPVLEALACGAVVVASDIAALREVGGTAAVYCPVGDVGAWATTVERLIDDPGAAPPRAERLAQAARFSWDAHARTIADAYLRLAGAG